MVATSSFTTVETQFIFGFSAVATIVTVAEAEPLTLKAVAVTMYVSATL